MRAALALGLALCAGTEVGAQPLSAIDWLSDSIATTPPPRRPEPPVSQGAGIEQITVVPLDRPSPDGIGLVDPRVAGLAPGLWGASSAEDLARLLAGFPATGLPAVQRQMRALLTARLDPPQGAPGLLFRARVDALLARGALPEAASMLAQADGREAEHFRRAFDIALLTGEEDAGCDRLRQSPGIAPSFSVRIFCLARTGDWPAAALTLETAKALGQVGPDEDLLLARFLDADIADERSLIALPMVPTPLSFRMLEAIGEPVPTSSLPLAFAHSDLRFTAGWKPRLEAAERLARAGALPAERLVEIYAERAPAASGGVWERVAAVRDLRAALEAETRRGLRRALPRAWAEMSAAGLGVVLAEAYGAAVAEAMPGWGTLAPRLGLLSPDYESVAIALGVTATEPDERFLAAIARGLTAAPPEGSGAMAQAVALGFSEAPPLPPEDVRRRMGDDRVGEALLMGLRALVAGAEADPAAVAWALGLLRRIGLEDTARRAALQLMLAEAG